ncbi:hypothetical protein ABZT49_30555 [Methylobacterium sp. EM32]|uniref:hypothetical protein n=1 Tax=Methylobacterium sp. EM32 TaxID=3163481 RepID=UPI0033B82692
MTDRLIITDPETIAIVLRQTDQLGTTPENVVLWALRAYEATLPPLEEPPAGDVAAAPDFIDRALARAASARAALPPEASTDQGDPYDDPDSR